MREAIEAAATALSHHNEMNESKVLKFVVQDTSQQLEQTPVRAPFVITIGKPSAC